PGFAAPAGLVYLPAPDAFLAAAGDPDSVPPGRAGLRIALASMLGDTLGTAVLEGLPADPLSVAFDSAEDSFLFLDPAAGELLEVGGGLAGRPSGTLNRHGTAPLRLAKPRGMAFDAAGGRLLILDAAGPRILAIAAGAGLRFDAGAAIREGRVEEILVQGLGQADLRGLALDEDTGLLYVLDARRSALYGLDAGGGIVSRLDLSALALCDPQGMVFAPSGDPTDDPLKRNLYLATSGRPGGNRADSGQIVELALAETATAITTLSTTTPALLVRTIKTSSWSPASPDPAGLTYLPGTNRLLITDSEVEEMRIWAGKNVWEMNL